MVRLNGVALAFVSALALGLLSCGSSSQKECTPNESQCLTSLAYRICSADGSWGSAARCPTGLTCDVDRCVDPALVDGDTEADGDSTAECTVGAKSCVLDMIRECQADGTWGSATDCESGKTCKDGACKSEQVGDCSVGDQKCNVDNTGFYSCQADNTWGTELSKCPDGQVCGALNGQCKDQNTTECDPAESRCNENGQVLVCTANGTWGNPTDCKTDEYCGGGRCIPNGTKVCEPAVETRCTGDGKMQVCNAQGTDWSVAASCPTGYTCSGKKCVSGSCKPKVDFKCSSDGRVQWCNDTGDGYSDPIDCQAGYTCNPNVADGCGPSVTVCTPNADSCKDDATIQTCNSDGSAYLPGTKPCEAGAEGRRCIEGVCAGLCEIAKLSKSYIGCEYYAVTLRNSVDDAFKKTNESEFAVVVSNTNDTFTANVTITYTGGGFTKSVTVAPNKNVTVRLPWKEKIGTQKSMNAFHIESTVPITAYQFNPLTYLVQKSCVSTDNPDYGTSQCHSFSNDASLLLPVHAWGTEYMALVPTGITIGADTTTMGGASYGYLDIIAAEDNTIIAFKAKEPTAAGGGYSALAAGGTLNVTLKKGEVLQIYNGDYSNFVASSCMPLQTSQVCRGADLTGSLITTNKPVAVLSGHECSYVPHYRMACDHLEEQLFPTNTWTSQYIAARMKDAEDNRPNLYKILAYADGTRISTLPASVAGQGDPKSGKACTETLAAGESCIILTSGDFVLLSNAGHPISVGQFFVGENFSTATVDEGDPSLIMLPPVEQFRYDYSFLIPDTYTTNTITLLSTVADPQITLDGQGFSFVGVAIKDSTTTYAYKMDVPITAGPHSLTAKKRVGITVYGRGSYVSYAYAAGLDLTYSPYKK